MAEKKIDAEIKSLENIQDLVQTYEEIAAGRMQKVKASVLNNRNFLTGLSDIFAQVKYAYDQKQRAEKEDKKKGKRKKEVVVEEGKTVSVLLSANTGLYGDIVRSTYDRFLKSVANKDTDVVVVGKVGKARFDQSAPILGVRDYTYFDLSDSTSDPNDFTEIISHIVKYDKVIVYHGRFESILSQVPVEETLTGELKTEEPIEVGQYQYIIEPTVEKVMRFFESEVLASIFEQAIHESSLSKFASRMINLDKAVVNIDESLEEARFIRQRAKHQNLNKKQLSMLSSMSLWK